MRRLPFLRRGRHHSSPLWRRTCGRDGKTDITVDLFQIRLMKRVLISRKPVFAICRGMQILSVACGGSIWQDMSLDPRTSPEPYAAVCKPQRSQPPHPHREREQAETVRRLLSICKQFSPPGSQYAWKRYPRKRPRPGSHDRSYRAEFPSVCHRRTVASGKYVPHLPGNAGTVRQFYPARRRIKRCINRPYFPCTRTPASLCIKKLPRKY